jgi:branched-chain amino acid transport system ATP-binding protein
MSLLEISGVRAGYGLINILWDVSLSIAAGKLTAIVGPNGAGKTTLLKAIMGQIAVTRGGIDLDHKKIAGTPPWKMVGKGVALVPEGRLMFVDMSVDENLMLGAFDPSLRARAGIIQKRIYDLFPQLWARRNQFAGSLSGGEAQMLAIGRALMAEPHVLLVDEPSVGLAPIMLKQIFAVLEQLKQQALTIVLVEQNTQRAVAIADHVLLMRGGRIVMSGAARDISLDELHAEYLK